MDRDAKGRSNTVEIDWPTFDSLRLAGHGKGECADRMGINRGTMFRRAWEREHGKTYTGKDGAPRLRYVAVDRSEIRDPSPPRRFSWQD